MISAGKATLGELNTVLGLGDLYDILEVMAVDAHNRSVMERRARRGAR